LNLAKVRRDRLTPKAFESILHLLVFVLISLLFGLSCTSHTFAADNRATQQPCELSDSDFDPATDVRAFEEYQDAIAQLLTLGEFTKLDCLADAARTGKTRFPGGSWKLRNIYLGLNSPVRGHATDLDWRQRLDFIQQWIDLQPRSITARIALAESYVGYAWFARGDGPPNTVSESGSRLFRERLEKSRTILTDASSLRDKCPEWYVAMQQVAQGQGWDIIRFKDLFAQAISFETGYDGYYRAFVDYLRPTSRGAEGDAAKAERDAAEFAQETANRVGGDAGDILYFYAAEQIVSPYENHGFQHFSWPRLQKGFLAIEKQYGVALTDLNSFALMASKNADWVVADETFKRIGENWDEKSWASEECFQQNRGWAAALAPGQVQARIYRREAEKNLQTRKGRAYEAKIRPKLATFEESCSPQASGQPKFDLLMQVGRLGGLQESHTDIERNPFTICLIQLLEATFIKKETPFPRPPKDGYRVLVNIDPANISAPTKQE
jgi:hypothetical protein